MSVTQRVIRLLTGGMVSSSLIFAFLLFAAPAGWSAASDRGSRGFVPNAYNDVCKAADQGEISLKDSVILRARLLYAPQTIGANEAFAPTAERPAVFEPCATGFTKDLHRVYPELSDVEKAWLSSLDPGVAFLLARKDQQVKGAAGPGPNALPNYNFEKEEEGKLCIVHYTTSGTHSVPNEVYAQLIRKYMDMGIKAMTKKHFRRAYHEGEADFKGKLHVYIVNSPGVYGEWKDITAVDASGKKMAGYILISNAMDDGSDTWQVKAKGTCYHEYFHGIQSAYNAWSKLWFLEATSVWAQCYYGGDWIDLNEVYGAADSVFKVPNDVIWKNTYRKYTTSALAFFLSAKYKGWKFFKSYYENSETEDDAIKILKTTIDANGSTFEEEFKNWLACMYLKKISRIQKYMPDVTLAGTHNAYGVDPTNATVVLTGANYYKMEPGEKPGTFIGILETTASKPEGFLLKNKSQTPIKFNDAGRGAVAKFGQSAKTVGFIVTDCTYAGEDATARAYKYSAIVPYVNITDITAESPIFSGGYSQIDITYDLLGTYPTQPFPVYIKVTEKGPDVADYVSGTYNLNVGEDQIMTFYFNTAYDTVGNYRFTFQFAVPPDDWEMPQVKSKGRCAVQVKEPPESAAPGTAGTDAPEAALLPAPR